MHKISEITDFSIFFNFAFITISMLNPYIISYNSAAEIIYITYLHFIEN